MQKGVWSQCSLCNCAELAQNSGFMPTMRSVTSQNLNDELAKPFNSMALLTARPTLGLTVCLQYTHPRHSGELLAEKHRSELCPVPLPPPQPPSGCNMITHALTPPWHLSMDSALLRSSTTVRYPMTAVTSAGAKFWGYPPAAQHHDIRSSLGSAQVEAMHTLFLLSTRRQVDFVHAVAAGCAVVMVVQGSPAIACCTVFAFLAPGHSTEGCQRLQAL